LRIDAYVPFPSGLKHGAALAVKFASARLCAANGMALWVDFLLFGVHGGYNSKVRGASGSAGFQELFNESCIKLAVGIAPVLDDLAMKRNGGLNSLDAELR